ncbi:EAL domain-containing protein [Vibrio sp. SCSIO 43135]|uniref:EAL domain-containing protein n=1 Tax=Vibrio sp. SCSIO 43135 TaxID=2819096 RepID=UPI002075F259|nr:EAL domain-containing protein [Vibrio sp. SCSIO 43135]USD42373.1 EAL domain-containing protein [Vibrio sp. SCSIO 43135]
MKKNHRALPNQFSLFWLIFPIPLMILLSGIVSVLYIGSEYRALIERYVAHIDVIVTNMHRENKMALNNIGNCEQIQKSLRYSSTIEELILVNKDRITCSSFEGEISQRVSAYRPRAGLESGIYTFNIPDEYHIQNYIVLDTNPTNPEWSAMSTVDRYYFRALLGYSSDLRVKKFSFHLHRYSQLPTERQEWSPTIFKASSQRYNYSISIEANSSYIWRILGIFILGSLPISVTISLTYCLIAVWLKRNRSMATHLEKGLKKRELFLVYQPIITSETNEVCGVEALLRWKHPVFGYVRPDIFIPIAEESSLINTVTDYVLERALTDFKHTNLNKLLHLGINVPPSYLADEENLKRLQVFKSQLLALNIKLGVEITERQLLNEQGQLAVADLHSLGIDILIDDFGTGTTSLSVLQNIRFDYLKIDKCFIDTIGVTSVNAPVLNSIIELANNLDVKTIAEGVETSEQHSYLVAKGVPYQQGYYHFKPMTLRHVLPLIKPKSDDEFSLDTTNPINIE